MVERGTSERALVSWGRQRLIHMAAYIDLFGTYGCCFFFGLLAMAHKIYLGKHKISFVTLRVYGC